MPSPHAEIKAGVFVALAAALLFVMVFASGKCQGLLRGRQEQTVLLSHVTGLQPNSAVNYNGVEVGRVRDISIVAVDDALLATMPRVTAEVVDRLPLSLEEADRLKAVADPVELDARARQLLRGRTMVVVVLEVGRGAEGLRFRQDDVVRVETTLMGESSVEVSAGSGAPLPEGRALLGDGSNLVTQLNASMRDIRKLLEKVSATIGEDERVAIKATVANIRKVTEDLARTSAAVAGAVEENRQAVRESLADFRASMNEARKTAEELRPEMVGAVGSARKMLESGQAAAGSAAEMLREARPRLLEALDSFRDASRAAATAIGQVEKLLTSAGGALEENRPAIRRAFADAREASRNIRETSERLRREPWLILHKPSGSQDAVLLEAAARSLVEASDNLASSLESLQAIAADPRAAARLGAGRAEDLIDELRAFYRQLEGRRDEVVEKLMKIDRKAGGALLERARERADRFK